MARRRGTTKNLTSIEDVLEGLRPHAPDLRQRYKISSLGVFGSYLRREQHKGSDLDILVEFEQAPTLFEFMDLQDELSQLLGVKVDLVSRKALKGEIGRRILEEAISL